jgi:biotin transport system substrate-specific component
VLLYLLEGAAGLPFFAGGAGGILFVGGPTGGYLLAFPVAAFVAGRLTERRGANPAWTFAAMLAGHAVIYAMGAGWLAAWMEARGMNPGIGGVLGAGVWPFLPGDGVKALAAAALVPGARRVYDECQ